MQSLSQLCRRVRGDLAAPSRERRAPGAPAEAVRDEDVPDELEPAGESELDATLEAVFSDQAPPSMDEVMAVSGLARIPGELEAAGADSVESELDAALEAVFSDQAAPSMDEALAVAGLTRTPGELEPAGADSVESELDAALEGAFSDQATPSMDEAMDLSALANALGGLDEPLAEPPADERNSRAQQELGDCIDGSRRGP